MKVSKDEKAHCTLSSVLVYGDNRFRLEFFGEID
jgi:hypothetical protein